MALLYRLSLGASHETACFIHANHDYFRNDSHHRKEASVYLSFPEVDGVPTDLFSICISLTLIQRSLNESPA